MGLQKNMTKTVNRSRMPKKKKRRFFIPKSIKIRGRKWRIFIEPETSKFRKEVSGGKTMAQERVLGWCYDEVREIHLSKELKGRRLEKIFSHELLHAMQPDEPFLSYAQDERVAMELGDPLAEVIGSLRRTNRGR